jgi:large repetitive protein
MVRQLVEYGRFGWTVRSAIVYIRRHGRGLSQDEIASLSLGRDELHLKASVYWLAVRLGACAACLWAPPVQAQVNSYTNTASGNWQAGSYWSLGVPPNSTQSGIYITNAASKTVTINSVTSSLFTNTLVISNLTVGSFAGTTNTLSLFNAGTNTPLQVIDGVTVTNGGMLMITNSALQVSGIYSDAFLVEGQMLMMSGASVLASNANVFAGMRVASNPGASGTLTVAGGTLTTVSANLYAGHDAGSTGMIWVTGGNVVVADKLGVATSGAGQMTVSNGTVSPVDLVVGELSGSDGTVTLAGGTTTISDVMVIGRLSSATGGVWMTGGELMVTDNPDEITIEVGGSGVGQMTVSNGTVAALQIEAGSGDGGVGTFTVAGGTVTAGDGLYAAGTNTAHAAIWIDGGQLQVTSNLVDIGFQGSGQLTVSNGTVAATNMIVADFAGSQGLFTMAGGTLTLSGFLNVGEGGTGSVVMAGGFLAANQAPGNLMIVSNGVSVGFGSVGTMLVTNGLALLNPLLVGNVAGADGTLTVAGGSVSVSAANPAVASLMALGNMAGATGTCWITGGELLITNSGSVAQLQIGSFGVGQMTVSGGVMRVNSIFVGSFPGSQGTLTVVGGTVIADLLRLGTNNNTRGTLLVTGGTFTVESGTTNALLLGDAPGATGLVQVTGGDIMATNVPTQIGSLGYGQMTVFNGTVQNGRTDIGAGTNTFGSLAVAGGNVTIYSNLTVGLAPGSTGMVMVSAGNLTVMNAPIAVGNDGTVTSGSGVGFMTVSNGTVVASSILLGSSAGGHGQLTIQTNGVVKLVGANAMVVANDLILNGGTLAITNGILYCGQTHPGAMTMSNGSAVCQIIYVGDTAQGTLTMSGGQITLTSYLEIGQSLGSTGSVWMSGGQLTATAETSTIGNQGVGQMSISNGIVTMADVVVGNTSNPGTLTLAGGTLTLNTLSLPNSNSRFNFTGGRLNTLGITNSNGQMLTLGNGVTPLTLNLLGGISSLGNGLQIAANTTFTGFGTINGSVLNYGTIAPGSGPLTFTGIVTNYGLIITNSTVHFSGGLVNNGTLEAPVIVSPATLPGGMINVTYNQTITASGGSGGGYTFSVLSGALPGGLSLNSSTGALTGTPTTPGSATFTVLATDSNGYPGTQQYTVATSGAFAITAVAKQGNDIRVTWNCGGGYTNILQSTQTAAAAGYSSNLFFDVSPLIIMGGVGQSTTNYLDIGAATNSPARFYRVRLAQ